MRGFGFFMAVGFVIGGIFFLSPILVFVWTTFNTVAKALGAH